MAGLYLVGAWLITQVAGTILPMFDAPAWLPRSIVLVLAIGFIPAIIFSWVFELTPEGLKRDSEIPEATSIAPQTARKMERSILVLFAIALAFFGVDKFYLAPKREAALVAATSQTVKAQTLANTKTAINEASIAVLPFVNMSTDAENGFFADGISEELLNVLAGVDGLKVASRTSAFSFKGKDTPIPEIARQLGVQHVLEGSVRKQGQRVRITAQLIRAGTDKHLWSKTYDRDLTDIFKVQEEIAQAITQELESILGKRQVAVAASTDNLDAYQSFLKGRSRFHGRNQLLAAIKDLSKAVKLDPDFAEAWIYLSATWFVAPGYHADDEIKPAKARAESRAALKRAEALAPKHPMVLALRANFLEDEGDLVGALALLQESAKLSTQDSNPMMWRGLLLLRAGYVDEAIAVLESAQIQDPLSGINNGYLAMAYLSAGQYEKAEAAARKAASQGWTPAIFVIIYDLAARGEHERALAIWDELVAPGAQKANAGINAAVRALLVNPANNDAFTVLHADDRTTDLEFTIAINRFDLLLDLVDQVQKQKPEDRRRQWWMRTAWLPSTLALRENPRFFALAEDLGMVRLWETRGYPNACKRVKASSGEHLDCEVTGR